MTQPTEPDPTSDELERHLDWSFWGTGMADTFREPLAEAMLAGITPEQREHANALITRWRDHREFVGRDKYEEQKAEIDRLTAELEQARAAAPLLVDRADLTELAAILTAERYRLDKGDGTPVPQPRWGANVRISQAVNAALTAPACSCRAETVHQRGCPAALAETNTREN